MQLGYCSLMTIVREEQGIYKIIIGIYGTLNVPTVVGLVGWGGESHVWLSYVIN